jgi:hypothetical protein
VAQASPVKPQNIPSSVSTEINEPGTAGFSRAPLKSAAKAPIVTKEQMTKAGFDNLRDYMNAQKGLTRRQEPPKPAPAQSAKPAKPMGRTAMGKTAEQEMAAIEAGKKLAGKADLERRMAYDKPLERVTPEANLIGGPGLRALRSAGAGLASKIAPQAAKPRVEPKIPQEAANAFPKKPDPPRGGGKDPNARRPTRDELDEIRMGSDYMRKGGKVGSASRRADGIASRGKTRGRYI